MAGTTDTVPAMLTPGEFVIKQESAAMLGAPLLRKLNAVSDNAPQGYQVGGGVSQNSGAHGNIDALIGQAQLANMKPMSGGMLSMPFSLLANILNKPAPRTSTVLSPEEQILMELESGTSFPKTDVPSPEEEILNELISSVGQNEKDRPISSPFKGYQEGGDVDDKLTFGQRFVQKFPSKHKDPERASEEQRGLASLIDFIIPQSKLDVALSAVPIGALGKVGTKAGKKAIKKGQKSIEEFMKKELGFGDEYKFRETMPDIDWKKTYKGSEARDDAMREYARRKQIEAQLDLYEDVGVPEGYNPFSELSESKLLESPDIYYKGKPSGSADVGDLVDVFKRQGFQQGGGVGEAGRKYPPGTLMSPFMGDKAPIPEAWMQPATDSIPSPEEVAEFERMIKTLQAQELLKKQMQKMQELGMFSDKEAVEYKDEGVQFPVRQEGYPQR